jgi:hypothetical protein
MEKSAGLTNLSMRVVTESKTSRCVRDVDALALPPDDEPDLMKRSN